MHRSFVTRHPRHPPSVNCMYSIFISICSGRRARSFSLMMDVSAVVGRVYFQCGVCVLCLLSSVGLVQSNIFFFLRERSP